jgi:hypothetical protein
MHDGMSLRKGKGRGCYATFTTLTAAIGCDASNLSKSLKRLVDWGYLSEERQDDRRRKTYRVIFDAENVGETTNKLVGDNANERPEIVGNGESGNGRNPPLDGQHYSSLKGLDTLERDKLDSSEEARLAARGSAGLSFTDNVCGQLARFERHWRESPNSYPVDTLEQWASYCEQALEAFECGDPEYGQAERLSGEIDLAIEELRNGRPQPTWANG